MTEQKTLKQTFRPIQKAWAWLLSLPVFSLCRHSQYTLIVCADEFDCSCVQEIFRHIKQAHNKGRTILLDISAGEINGKITSLDFLEVSVELLDPKKLKELWLSA